MNGSESDGTGFLFLLFIIANRLSLVKQLERAAFFPKNRLLFSKDCDMIKFQQIFFDWNGL